MYMYAVYIEWRKLLQSSQPADSVQPHHSPPVHTGKYSYVLARYMYVDDISVVSDFSTHRLAIHTIRSPSSPSDSMGS